MTRMNKHKQKVFLIPASTVSNSLPLGKRLKFAELFLGQWLRYERMVTKLLAHTAQEMTPSI